MERLLTLLKDSEAVKAFESGQTVAASGIDMAQTIMFASYFHARNKEPVLFITEDEASAINAAEDFKEFFKEGVLSFPERELWFHGEEGHSLGLEHQRIEAISALTRKKAKVLISSIGALMHPSPDFKEISSKTMKIKRGGILEIEGLCKYLEGAGYEFSKLVEGRGQYAARGGIVDIFSPGMENPLRIEFFDNEIDGLAFFDPATQRRTDEIKEALILPAREVLLSEKKRDELERYLKEEIKNAEKKGHEKAAGILKADLEWLKETGRTKSLDRYLPVILKNGELASFFEGRPVILYNSAGIAKRAEDKKERFKEDVSILFEQGILQSEMANGLLEPYEKILTRLEESRVFLGDMFLRSSYEIKSVKKLEVNSSPLPGITHDLEAAAAQIGHHIKKKNRVIILSADEGKARRLSKQLGDFDLIVPVLKDALPDFSGAGIILGHLSSGFMMADEGAAIFTEAQPPKILSRRRTKKKKGGLTSYSDLKRGDYIVHQNHGIGRFEGIKKVEMDAVTRDYLKIAYHGGDYLYVPCTQLEMVSKYIAPGEGRVRLSKMGTDAWNRTKAKVKAEAAELAKDLIKLYAERENISGFAFPPDDDIQTDFEARFIYKETDDQLRCIREIKDDMEGSKPMDRILCGDVGVGKTEVALRAVCKAVSAGKQAAVLVPTTLLANQHYETIKERFSHLPVSVDMLSRFRTRAEQTKTLERLKKGQLDIVVGTHRIIQKDIKFKDLGLLIVDEEQRFGVTHKERLKEMTKNIDVLTLSATPIPRTLNFGLSGIRDMSMIEEPPSDRIPVMTYVMEKSPGAIKEAIEKEMRRGGQVFYLHNRTESIEKTVSDLRKLAPLANIVFAHGQMDEETLSRVMEDFIAGKADVLVCTTIIETGLDIPNVNTLIIDDAQRLGLAQLYQIRGRVGRSRRQAYAFLMVPQGRALSQEATSRLQAIKEFCEFGSGFQIALRDLEIRGAGSILGHRQHGHMEAVGYDMYIRLLSEAVSEEKGEEAKEKRTCTMDLFVNAFIPESYIKDAEIRIEIYQKIAQVESDEDSIDITDEIIDRFGDIPQATVNLIEVARLKSRAADLGVREISQKESGLSFELYELSPESFNALHGHFKKGITFHPGGDNPSFTVSFKKEKGALCTLKEILDNFGLQSSGIRAIITP